MTNHLSTKVMLVDLSISFWTAKKYDRKVSKEVADNHKTTEKVGRYRKNLMMDAPSLEAISKAMGAAHTEHYKRTLPWSDGGVRILTAAGYLSYTPVLARAEPSVQLCTRGGRPRCVWPRGIIRG